MSRLPQSLGAGANAPGAAHGARRRPPRLKRSTMKTDGISPKLIAATIAAILTYILGQTLLGLPPVATVTGQAILIALAAYAAPPGNVTAPTATRDEVEGARVTRPE